MYLATAAWQQFPTVFPSVVIIRVFQKKIDKTDPVNNGVGPIQHIENIENSYKQHFSGVEWAFKES